MLELITELPRDEAVELFGQHWITTDDGVRQVLGQSTGGHENTIMEDALRVHAKRTRRDLQNFINLKKDLLDSAYLRTYTRAAEVFSVIGWGGRRAWAKKLLADISALKSEVADKQALLDLVIDDPLTWALGSTPITVEPLPEKIAFRGFLPIDTPLFIVKTNRDDKGPTLKIVEESINKLSTYISPLFPSKTYSVTMHAHSVGFGENAIDPASGEVTSSTHGWWIFLTREAAEARAREFAETAQNRLKEFLPTGE